MNKLKTFIALYFNLSRKESNGFIVLCLLVMLFIFLPIVGRSIFSSETPLASNDRMILDSLTALFEDSSPQNTSFQRQKNSMEKVFSFSTFNPNMATEQEMINAGVPEFLSKRIVKFRNKGAVFKTKADVKKLYGLSETLYRQLYAYIDLPEKTDPSSFHTFQKKSYERNTTQPFDLNLVDSARLVALKGIGPAFASRILKYRKKLGGYIHLSQLKEVYGLDSIAYQELSRYGFINKNFTPEKIHINQADETIFYNHPYIGKRFSKTIINYRKMHGMFTGIEQLKNIQSISEESYLKMIPYLTIE